VKNSFVRVLPTVLPAVAATLLVHESSANPPPPKVLPDPPITAPAKDEPPTLVRKHDGLCFGFYPAGGTLPVVCPSELITEPLGEAILKNPAGRCQFIPFQSGNPGRTGYLDKCPPIFSESAKAGVIPDEAVKLLQEATAKREPATLPAMDPPIPARLETTPPQQVGCGGCGTSRRDNGSTAAIALAAAATVRRRRRSSRVRR
jgi:hypothetical protein